MRALLDINVLLALLDENHLSHRDARKWFESEVSSGWASCALTQNGYVRIVTQQRYGNSIAPRAALDLLGQATGTTDHQFWYCSASILDASLVDRRAVHGPGQITDVYLLALAVAENGRLVTLDRSISRAAVPSAASEQLVVL